MILYPAIDIRGGRAVRLAQGDFARETVYEDDPVRAARAWAAGGARSLHVVDLDGARDGVPANLESLRRIAAAVEIPIQFGGGLRTPDAVRDAIAAGASRVILGTAAVRDVDLLDDALAEHGSRVFVSIDARGGMLSMSGWTEQTEIPADAAIARLQARGVRGLVYSSIARDGMLSGPDLDEVRTIAEAVRGRFIYSGGVTTLADLEALAGLRQVNLNGVIVGTALYEHRFSVADGQRALDAAERRRRAGSGSRTASGQRSRGSRSRS